MSEDKNSLSKLLIGEIIKGRSILISGKNKAYLKHSTVLDEINLQEFEREEIREAVLSGVKSEEQLIDNAQEYGAWTDEDELEIKGCLIIIEKTKESLKSPANENLIKALKETLQDNEKKLEELKKRKEKITSFSAETLASNKKIKKMIESSLFEDENCKKRMKHNKSVFFYSQAVDRLISLYKDENLARAAYEDIFFEAFVYQSRNPLALFNSDYKNITVHQSKILTYASIIFNKIRHSTKMSKEVMKDAIKILEHNDEAAEKQMEHKLEKKGLSDIKNKYEDGETVNLEDLFS